MSSTTLSYISRYAIADERTVNRLFVSAYIDSNRLNSPVSSFLAKYYIDFKDVDYELSQKVKECVKNEYGTNISLEVLVKLFEFVVSPADRIVTGAVYTPKDVRSTILQRMLDDKDKWILRRIRIADISCGCGGFLKDAAIWLHQKTGKRYADIFRENIYGVDIQDYAIERTMLLLSLLALSEGEDEDFEFNLLCRDTLDFIREDWDARYSGFDVVVGNPPYVCSRNLSKNIHVKLKNYEVCSSGHPDLYIPFFQIAVEMLNNKGRLGYITMNTFLRSVNGRAIRNYFSKNRFYICIVDFRGYQIFDSKNTYTCLFYLDKGKASEDIYYTVDENGVLSNDPHFIKIPFSLLDDTKGWSLNDFDMTMTIEDVGVQIKDFCPSRHGIATLSNATYIFRPVEEDEQYYYMYVEGRRFPIERGICRDIVNPNKLNTIDRFNLLIEKVIFPYHIKGNRAYVYTPDEMKQRFPRALEYLETRKNVLLCRDKGKTSIYSQWYAFGRTQSLTMPRYKLFFPKFASKPLRCFICDSPDLMLYNGLAFVNSEERKLKILKSVIESDLFWEYIRSNAKPYASGYYSLSGVDIKHFGVPKFTQDEEDELLALKDRMDIENWLRARYGIINKSVKKSIITH